MHVLPASAGVLLFKVQTMCVAARDKVQKHVYMTTCALKLESAWKLKLRTSVEF